MKFFYLVFCFTISGNALAKKAEITDKYREISALDSSRVKVNAKINKILNPKSQDFIEKQWSDKNSNERVSTNTWTVGKTKN